jgi:hypothetical protein
MARKSLPTVIKNTAEGAELWPLDSYWAGPRKIYIIYSFQIFFQLVDASARSRIRCWLVIVVSVPGESLPPQVWNPLLPRWCGFGAR